MTKHEDRVRDVTPFGALPAPVRSNKSKSPYQKWSIVPLTVVFPALCRVDSGPSALAWGIRLWEGYEVKHLVIASFASALVGGMSGTGLMLWMTRNEAAATLDNPPAAMENDADLARRVDAVERRLAVVEPHVLLAPTALTTAGEGPVGAEGAALGGQVGGPVIEAAVLDVVERADDGSDDRQPPTREERRRQHKRWANELTMRLGLTPAQTETLLVIQNELDGELERERRASTENGAYVPREQRRIARQAIRQRADQRVRGALAPRQQAAYDQLDEKLKIDRARDSD
jgi:hypothetical protein